MLETIRECARGRLAQRPDAGDLAARLRDRGSGFEFRKIVMSEGSPQPEE
jgi:hypothetical protein